MKDTSNPYGQVALVSGLVLAAIIGWAVKDTWTDFHTTAMVLGILAVLLIGVFAIALALAVYLFDRRPMAQAPAQAAPTVNVGQPGGGFDPMMLLEAAERLTRVQKASRVASLADGWAGQPAAGSAIVETNYRDALAGGGQLWEDER